MLLSADPRGRVNILQASTSMHEIQINGRAVGRDHPPYIIAEAGINHNGDLRKALDMVQVASDAGADGIKFQTFKAEELVGDPYLTYSYRSQGREVTESMMDMFRRSELPRSAWFDIKAECDRLGITFLSTPSSEDDLDLLMEVGVPAVKVGSDDLTNLPLLRRLEATGRPLILSCGMADLAEIRRSLEAIGALAGYPTVLLLCTSQYPTPPTDVNLNKLVTLQAAFPTVTLGFSDHTQGPLASSLAVALGAAVFEKHFTLDHGLPGPDHWFSEDPAGLAAWVSAIRTSYTMMGRSVFQPTDEEIKMRAIARRSIIALCPIERGEFFTADNIGLRRPGTGLPPQSFEAVLGGTASRSLRAGDFVTLSDVVR
jgi:N,N'-diacetyllegionaminate synthase